MRLGVIARRLSGQRLGIGRYIEYLLKYWNQMLAPSDEVVLFVKEPPVLNGLRLSEAFRIAVIPSALSGIAWENFALPRAARDIDVLFGPSYTIPLAYRGRSVVATHSVNEAEAGSHPWSYRLTYTPLYRLSALRAHRVIVPSESVRADLQRLYAVPAERMEIVPEGADDAFRPLSDPALASRIRARYFGSDRPFILFVGKLSQRRNIPTLMRAYALVKERMSIPHGLLLVGPNHLGLPLAALAGDLRIADSVVQTDGRFDSHQELIAIYNAADLYVYPSSYDGFSLTVVEAMACGVPLITVDRAALREIAGGSALMVEAPTVDALAEAMARMLSDPVLRSAVRERGLERARRYRWERTARETLDVLRRVAGDGHARGA